MNGGHFMFMLKISIYTYYAEYKLDHVNHFRLSTFMAIKFNNRMSLGISIDNVILVNVSSGICNNLKNETILIACI